MPVIADIIGLHEMVNALGVIEIAFVDMMAQAYFYLTRINAHLDYLSSPAP